MSTQRSRSFQAERPKQRKCLFWKQQESKRSRACAEPGQPHCIHCESLSITGRPKLYTKREQLMIQPFSLVFRQGPPRPRQLTVSAMPHGISSSVWCGDGAGCARQPSVSSCLCSPRLSLDCKKVLILVTAPALRQNAHRGRAVQNTSNHLSSAHRRRRKSCRDTHIVVSLSRASGTKRRVSCASRHHLRLRCNSTKLAVVRCLPALLTPASLCCRKHLPRGAARLAPVVMVGQPLLRECHMEPCALIICAAATTVFPSVTARRQIPSGEAGRTLQHRHLTRRAWDGAVNSIAMRPVLSASLYKLTLSCAVPPWPAAPACLIFVRCGLV